MNKKHLIGLANGLFSALCVSGYLVVNKYVYTHYSITAAEYTTLFLIIGGVYGLLLFLVQTKRKAYYEDLRRNIKPIFILSLPVTLAMGFLIFGQSYTTSTNASILATSSILATLFWSYVFLKESLSRRQGIWALIMLTGLYIGIVGFSKIQLKIGDLIIIGSIIFFGFGNAFSRVIMKRVDNPGVVPYSRLIIGGALSLIGAAIFFRDIETLLTVLPFALVASGFYWMCMVSFSKSVHLLDANEAVVLNQSQIFFTSIAGVLLLSESYSIEKLMGSLLVIISIYFITAHKRIKKGVINE
jgi:drug/metabolite transporter (DMT)-like permease